MCVSRNRMTIPHGDCLNDQLAAKKRVLFLQVLYRNHSLSGNKTGQIHFLQNAIFFFAKYNVRGISYFMERRHVAGFRFHGDSCLVLTP